MDREHYQVRYWLDGVDSFLIWYSNDSDGVVVEGDGSVPSFRARSALSAYAERWGLAFEAEEPSEFDLDAIEHWLSKPEDSQINFRLFLNAWNLFDVVAFSTGDGSFGRTSREASGVYDKLFLGNNNPAVTPSGEDYVPVWAEVEVAELHRILSGTRPRQASGDGPRPGGRRAARRRELG
jgi:hypothetical protein